MPNTKNGKGITAYSQARSPAPHCNADTMVAENPPRFIALLIDLVRRYVNMNGTAKNNTSIAKGTASLILVMAVSVSAGVSALVMFVVL